INYESIKYILEGSSSECSIIFISTDHVFNGLESLYRENDLPDPINRYAEHKLLTEYYLLSNRKNSFIVRTNALYSWLDGEDVKRKNFSNRIFDILKSGETCKVPTDEYVTPTYSSD